MKKFSPVQIRSYWKQQALKYGMSYAASWSDRMLIDMEIREIDKYLMDGDDVLDVGCANGYSTVQLAGLKQIKIKGIDFIREMVVHACSVLNKSGSDIKNRVDFKVGDITDLKEPAATYDKVIVVRVLINLHSWNRQLKALRECIKVLKPGGTLLLSEATLQGWQRLNKFRQDCGLSDIPMPPFNQYLDQKKVVKAVSSSLKLINIVDFSSTYYIGTRVLKPLIMSAIGMDSKIADPDTEWNRWFAQLPSWGDYGTQKLFVFKKI